MLKCDKPLNKEWIKKNFEKYFAVKNKAKGKDAGGEGNINRNKERDKDNKKNDANPVDF